MNALRLVLVVLFIGAFHAKAGIPILWDYDAEKTVKVSGFPQTEDYKTKEGIHVDAGCIYKQLRIFWIPVWNYDVRWCGYIESPDKYYIFSKSELDGIAHAAGITLPIYPTLPFWDSYGGKLIFFIILIVVAMLYLGRETEKEKPPQPLPARVIPRQTTMERPPVPVPVSIPLSARLQKTSPDDLKCCCVNCGQKLAFEPYMLNTTIQCPACNRETRLFLS